MLHKKGKDSTSKTSVSLVQELRLAIARQLCNGQRNNRARSFVHVYQQQTIVYPMGREMTDIQVDGDLRKGSAAGWFVVAYIAITVLATGFSLALESLMHVGSTVAPLENPAYLLAEKFFPLMNLVVWTACGGLYFRGQQRSAAPPKDAWMLGAVWLIAAVIVDFVGFVLIKNPLSLTPKEFYVGQFPWIYLIYVAVAIGPACALYLKK